MARKPPEKTALVAVATSALVDQLAEAYRGLVVGSPFSESTLVDPLIDGSAFDTMQGALKQAAAEGGTVVVGGERRQAMQTRTNGLAGPLRHFADRLGEVRSADVVDRRPGPRSRPAGTAVARSR